MTVQRCHRLFMWDELRSTATHNAWIRIEVMTKHTLMTLLCLLALIVLAPTYAPAQTFKVEKFDIKGAGGPDYVTVEPATGRVFVSRGTHMMVVDGSTGKVVGNITNTPGVHGAGIATKYGHGFTTNSGD